MTGSPGIECNLYQAVADARLLFKKDARHAWEDVQFYVVSPVIILSVNLYSLPDRQTESNEVRDEETST